MRRLSNSTKDPTNKPLAPIQERQLVYRVDKHFMPKEQFVSFIRYCHYLFVRNVTPNLRGNTCQTNCDLFRFRTMCSMTGSIVSKLTWIMFLGLDHLDSLGTLGNEELQFCAAVNGSFQKMASARVVNFVDICFEDYAKIG